ncbi:Cleft lip and palate transmembrane protein 1 like protein [Phytophthora boehmeriae]|uniref:Cleft lip and palate transmembrane protein 1 like protein n=1 Tax=Phytophthora boehmeriae TaxID=109152 RepID=A0A8T1WZZ3_9STRA|nr:Cleft lip and palate transmembrane protein 1 like protein [Phytophthora boehmeriae]
MADAAVPATAEGDVAPAQESFMDRLWPMLRMLCFYYAITSAMNLLMPQRQQQQHRPPRDSVSDVQVASTAGTDANTRALQLLENTFHLGDLCNLRVYINSQEQFAFAPDEDTAAVQEEQQQLRWYQDALTYDATPNPEREDGVWTQEMNVSVDEHLLRNGSVYAHVFLTKEGYSPNPTDSTYDNMSSIYRTLELTAFRPPPKIVKKRNLLVDEETEAKEEGAPLAGQVDGEEAYVLMWKPAFYVNVVLDHSKYSARQPPPPFVSTEMDMDQEAGLYKPVLFMNEFWMLEEHLIPVNDTLAALPLQISFYTLPMYKYALYTQMEQNFKNQEATGASSKRDTDNMKSMFIETNPYLLAVTMVVSLLHSLFDFLAFKNDVSFWKNQKSLVGLSLRTIVLNTFFQLVIFLYLMDNDTSWLILVQSGIALIIDVWKIKKAIVFSRDADNKLVVSGVESYEDSPTAEHDRVAVAHLSYVLYPLIVGQAAYTLAYGVHKGWYSWVVSSLTSFVYAFGFIMMTPQLYINYKLKSVAHLPWRAMVYKSLNTFIDDLFAFVIKMPWMHRLSCFRDDLIFFIYLYQRWKYPVDVKRTNEFGQGPIEEDEAANTIEGTPTAGNVEGEVVASEDVAAAVDGTEDIPPPPSTPPSTEYLMSKRNNTLEKEVSEQEN